MHSVQQDPGGFEEIAAQQFIAPFRDPASIIELASLMAFGCEANIGANAARFSKAVRIIDRRCIGCRDNRVSPGRCHLTLGHPQREDVDQERQFAR